MLVTSIFSFSQNVFYSIKDRNYHLSKIYSVVCKCFQFGQGQIFVVWEWVKPRILIPYHTILTSTTLKKKMDFENIGIKGKNAGSQNFFSFSHNVFYPIKTNFINKPQSLCYLHVVSNWTSKFVYDC